MFLFVIFFLALSPVGKDQKRSISMSLIQLKRHMEWFKEKCIKMIYTWEYENHTFSYLLTEQVAYHEQPHVMCFFNGMILGSSGNG